MIYLSRLVLNPRSPDVLRDLGNPYQLHRTLMSGFPPNMPPGERVLFRVEVQRIEPFLSILVQSHNKPDWEKLARSNYLNRPAAVKTVDLRPEAGQVFRFRLLANPTKRLRSDGTADGPRVGLTREEDQLAWLLRKGERHGFRVLEARTAKVAQPDGLKIEQNKRHRIRQQAVRFDGLLQVTDAELFARSLSDGIGSGKGMGFGLLSLARAG